jgi:glycerophosphoryl diester phosphodiesterase
VVKRGNIVFLIVIIFFIIYFGSMLSPALYMGNAKSTDSLINNIVLTGHRGAGGLAPENTIAAVVAGLSKGVDRIEVDVSQTKDRQIVCLHDSTLDRTTNGKGNIKNLNYSELKKISAGLKFSESFKDEKIPLLNDVLEIVKDKATLLIEIKDGNEIYPGIEKNVIDLIKKHQAKDRTIIHSFNDSVLFRIHRMDSTIVLHKLLIADFPFLQLLTDGDLKISNLEYYHFASEFSIHYLFATRRFIDHVHRLNKKVNVWTINDSIKINRLINLGVDGIITDRPDYLKRDTIRGSLNTMK